MSAVLGAIIAAVTVTPEVMRRWYADALAFAVEALGFKPDEWQVEVLRLVSVSPKRGLRVAMMACKGPGKSALLAVIVLWFLFTRPHAKIVCSSITGKNLRDGLWSELFRWGAPLRGIFEFSAARIQHRSHEDWFCSARAWSRDADPGAQADTLAGIHADYVLMILDEVSDYPEGVVAAAEGALTTGIETMIIVAGNCTRTVGSPLYRMATRDRFSERNPMGWRVFRITGDPDDPKCSPRVNKDVNRALILQWGRDHAIVRTNVLAEFPLQGSNKMLGVDDVRKAMDRDLPSHAFSGAARVIGVDVARFGDDKTIFFPRQGRVAFKPRVYPYANRSFLGQARDLIEMANRFQMDAGFIEVNGLGAGLWDDVQQLDQTGRFIAVNTSSTEGVDPRFHNLRAQIQWTCAEWVKDGAVLPDLPELLGEATAVEYDVQRQSGKLIIAPKEDLKAMIGHSPDYWDALCVSHAAPVVSKAALTAEYQPQFEHDERSRFRDYNPFARRVA